MKSLESGKDFGKNLGNALKEQFKSLVLKPTISAMMSPISGALSTIVTGAMGGGASASGGAMGLVNGASTLNSAYNLYNGGGSSLTAPGSMYYNFATSGVGQSLGLSNAAPIIGNNVSAYMPAATQLTSPAAFTSANSIGGMGVMGTAGVVALVAAVVLNAVGAFRTDTKVGSGLRGTLGGDQLQPWEEWREGGTLFDGSSFETTNPLEQLALTRSRLKMLQDSGQGAGSEANALQAVIHTMSETTLGLEEATRKQSVAIQAGYETVRKNTVTMGNSLGLAGDSLKDFKFQLDTQDLNFDGLDAAGVQAKIQAAYDKSSNKMAETILGHYEKYTETITRTIQDSYNSSATDESFHEETTVTTGLRYAASEYAKTGETAIETLTRLSTSFAAVNDASEMMGMGLQTASLSAAAFASGVVESFGGLERFGATTGAFFQNFYSGEAQRQQMANQGSRSLAAMGWKITPEQLLGLTRTEIADFFEGAIRGGTEGFDTIARGMEIFNSLSGIWEPIEAAAPAVQNLTEVVDEMTQKFISAKDALQNDAKSLAVDLLRAQGNEAGAKALEKANYLSQFAGLDEPRRQELATGYDANMATRRAIDAQNERNGLQNELNGLTDTSVQALTRQRNALDESNRALFDNVQAVKLQQTIAQELPGVLDKYMLPAQRRKAQYGTVAADLTAAGIGVTADQLANASKGQFADAATAVYNLGTTTDDMRLALVRAAGVMADIKDAEVDEAFANLQRVVGLQQEIATKTRDDIKAVFDLLKSSVDELYNEVDSTARMRAAEGQDYIAKTLAVAQSGGKILDAEELGKAISAARSGLDSTQYTSQFERDKDRLVLAGKLSDLEEISGEQLSEAETQVETLKGILEKAQGQIDALDGINTGVGDVAQAVQALADAINGRATDSATTRPSNVITGKGQASFNTSTGEGTTRTGVHFEREALLDAAREVLIASPDASGAMSIYKALESGGYSLADYNTMFGMPAGTLEAEAQKLGMKVFHKGTPFVPSTGFALLQRGEAVIPTAYNPFVHGRSLGDTARLEAHLEKLTGEVMRLQSLQTLGNTHAQATVELLDNVTEGGNGMRAEIMNKVELAA